MSQVTPGTIQQKVKGTRHGKRRIRQCFQVFEQVTTYAIASPPIQTGVRLRPGYQGGADQII